MAKVLKFFSTLGVRLGSAGSRQVPNAAEQIRKLRAVFQQGWSTRGLGESSWHRFYRQIKPSWGVDRSLSIPEKKLRPVLTRFRAGCYLLNSGPRHGHSRGMGPHGTARVCPCCLGENETVAHFFFECPAYEQERTRFRLHRFSGAGSMLTSVRRLFVDKRSRQEALARFIALAWRVRDRYLKGEDFLQLWDLEG